MNRRYMVLGAAALAVVALGAFETYRLVRPNDIFAQCRNLAGTGGNMVAGGDIGGPFTLVDTSGSTVTDKQLITKPTLLYFGYTFCPDVCPIDNARNSAVADELAQAGHDVTPVFISVDPKRDTPQVMKEYISNFSPRMVGLTGSPEQVKAAAKAYRVFYNIPDPQDEYYTVNHTALTYLVLPGHGFVDLFPHTATEKDLVKRISCYLDKAGS